MKITYDQGSEFIGHEFRKPLIDKYYGITAKPSSSGNPTYNVILPSFLHSRKLTDHKKGTYQQKSNC